MPIRIISLSKNLLTFIMNLLFCIQMTSSKIIVFVRVIPPSVDNTSAAQLRSSDNV